MNINRNYLLLLFLLVLGLFLYSKVILSGPFLFDDNLSIELNKNIRNLTPITKFFKTSLEHGSNFYRPFQNITHAVLFKFWKLNPIPYHLFSVILHVLNSFLVFLLLKRLNFKLVISYISSVIFLAHPVQPESVSYLTGFSDVLVCFFLLIGCYFFLRIFDVNTKKKLLNSIPLITSIFFICALLSRETAVVFPVLCLIFTAAYWNVSGNIQKKLCIINLIILTIITLFYLYVKFYVVNFTGVIGLTAEKNIYTENLHIRLITFINVLWDYAKLIFFPIHLYLEKPYIAYVEVFTLRALFGFSVFFSGLIFAYFSLSKKKILFISYCWFFGAFIPVSGIIPLNAIYLEHWLYTPIIGLLIGVCGLYDYIKDEYKKILIGFLSVFILFFSVRTYMRNIEWSNKTAFFLNELKYAPRSARVHNNLAMEYAEKENIERAVFHYKKAISIRDTYPQTHHNLANLYLTLGKNNDAYNEFIKAIEMDPNFIYSYVALNKLFAKTGYKNRAQLAINYAQIIQKGGRITSQDVQRVKNWE